MYDLCVRVLWLVVAGCGRVAFDPRAGDAPAGTIDTPADARACTWSAFSTPQLLPAAVLSSSDDWFPTPTADGHRLFFYSFRSTAFAEIYEAPANPYGAAQGHAELEQGTNDIKWPTLTADGLDLIYGAHAVNGFNLWEARRSVASGAFSGAVQLDAISTGDYDFGGFVSGDGLRLYFISERTGPPVLFEATRPDLASPFAIVMEHDELSLGANGPSVSPTVSDDGLELFYSANPVNGQYDVFTARRTALGAAFGTPQPVPDLDSAMDDIGLRLSRDGTTMYFNYNSMETGGGNADMWTATRTCN